MRTVELVAGLVLVLGTWSSVLRTLVVPRGLSSKLTAVVNRVVDTAFDLVAGRFARYETRDAILVFQGPAILVTLLGLWVALFLVGFQLLFAAVDDVSLFSGLREGGSWLFTLGSVSTARPAATAIGFFAAATGLVVVALQVAYLPTLYGAFNRRETLVTMLQSRAGLPAWGPEVLARAQIVATLDALPAFYAEWERWSAELAESHTNYPVLILFRSPGPLRSWVVGLLAVLDSAAMYLALNPGMRQSEARLCLRMGFTSLREVCRAMRIPFDPDPLPTDPIALTYEDFLGGVARLQAVGFPMERTAEEAWPHFRGWRVNYEALAYALAREVHAVPAVWAGPRRRGEEPILPVRPPNRTPDRPAEG